MSLQDSLFLDPVSGEVWIAYRTDGIKGSGTLSDPLDASTRYAAPVNVTSATNTGGDLLEATANTSAAHGFSNGDVVTIDGVTGSGAARWNGTFVIYSVT